jgi:hypothetical protein
MPDTDPWGENETSGKNDAWGEADAGADAQDDAWGESGERGAIFGQQLCRK